MPPALMTDRLRAALAVLAGAYLVLLQTNLMNAPRSVVLGLMGVVALLVAARADARADAALAPGARAIAAAFLAGAAWSVASLAWSVDRAITMTELRADIVLTAVGAAAILLCVRETVAFRRIVTAILATFALLACAAIGLAFAADPWNDKLMHHGAGTWSTHLVIVAPLILLVRAPEPAGWGRGRGAGIATVALACLVLAAARSSENRMVWPALFASLVVVGIAFALRGRGSRGTNGGRARAALAFVALGVLMALAFVEAASRKADSHLPAPMTIERSVSGDPRLAIWPLAREKIGERPWLGHGFGKEILGGQFAAKLGDPTLTHAHNVFLSVLMQTGVVGIALFLALLAATAWRFVSYARSGDEALARAGIAGLAIVAGVLVKNVTDDFFVRSNLRFLWGVVALFVAFGERRLREVARPRQRSVTAPRVSAPARSP